MKTAQDRVAHLLWIAVLAFLPATSCFRSLDPKNLTCTAGKKDSCPSGYYCATDGTCKESAGSSGGNTAGSSGIDASADAPVYADVRSSAGVEGTAGAGGLPGTGGLGGGLGGHGGTAGAGGIAGVSGTGGAAGLAQIGGGAAGAGQPAGGQTGGAGGAGGTPSASECTPNQHTCTGNTLLTCTSDGRWPSTGTTCPYVCKANTCSGSCSPDSHLCSGDRTLLTCDAAGNWPTTGSTCPFVCRNNACAGECEPNKFRCSGQTPQTCNADGKWTSQAACTSEYLCSEDKKGCVCAFTQCSDGRCIDTRNDPANCGACGRVCPGGQCKAAACTCTAQSPANLIANGGFDSPITTWSTGFSGTSISRSSKDASDCGSSGSLLLTTTKNEFGNMTAIGGDCIPVSPSTKYNFGAWVYVPPQSPLPHAFIKATWTLATDCTGQAGYPDNPSVGIETFSGSDSWQYIHQEDIVLPSDAKAAKIMVATIRGTPDPGTTMQVTFDSIYLTPAPGRF